MCNVCELSTDVLYNICELMKVYAMRARQSEETVLEMRKKISRTFLEVDAITSSVTYSKEFSRHITNWETLLHVDG